MLNILNKCQPISTVQFMFLSSTNFVYKQHSFTNLASILHQHNLNRNYVYDHISPKQTLHDEKCTLLSGTSLLCNARYQYFKLTSQNHHHNLHTFPKFAKRLQKIPLTFSSLVDSSPAHYQQYLRLLRLHQPIGEEHNM